MHPENSTSPLVPLIEWVMASPRNIITSIIIAQILWTTSFCMLCLLVYNVAELVNKWRAVADVPAEEREEDGPWALTAVHLALLVGELEHEEIDWDGEETVAEEWSMEAHSDTESRALSSTVQSDSGS